MTWPLLSLFSFCFNNGVLSFDGSKLTIIKLIIMAGDIELESLGYPSTIAEVAIRSLALSQEYP